MLLRGYPDMTITPFAEFTKLLNFRVLMLDVVFDRQTERIENTNISTQTPEYPRTFEC